MRPSGGRHARDAAGAVTPLEASRAKSQGAEVGRVFGRATPRAPATRGAVSDARIQAERGHIFRSRGGHAPKGMLSERNCVQAAAPAKATTVAMPMAPPVGLTGAMTPMMRSRARREVCLEAHPGEGQICGRPFVATYGYLV